MLADADRIGCDAIWSLGDLVGRGPHPNEVLEEVRAREVTCIQGNWDEAVAMERDQPGVSWSSQQAEVDGRASLAWTSAVIADEHRSFLRQRPPIVRFQLESRFDPALPRVARSPE